MSDDISHTHVINKQALLLYKSMDFVTCEICGMSFKEIMDESRANKQQSVDPGTKEDN